MEMMKTLSLILFFLVTGIHLYASFRKDRKLRNITKPFILLLLLTWYLFSTEKASWTIILALLFSWLGDVLLIPKGNKWFTAGGIAFMISHFFFILSYAAITDFSRVPLWPKIVLPLLFFLSSSTVFYYLRPHLPKALFWPMLLYLLINGTMNCFAWFRSLSVTGKAGLITALGALFFYISDCSLFFVRFKKDSRMKTHFWVMLTYSLGEFLIILGLLMK